MANQELHKTIFYDRHINLEAKIIEFEKLLMPLSYATGIVNEHLLTRKKAGLFDVSHMGRFIIKGQNAIRFLQNQFKALKKILNKDFSLIVHLPRRIMPFTLLDKGIARHGDKVYFNEKHIGFVTRGTAVPYWETTGESLDTDLADKKGIISIGLALLDSYIWDEDIVDIDIRGKN